MLRGGLGKARFLFSDSSKLSNHITASLFLSIFYAGDARIGPICNIV